LEALCFCICSPFFRRSFQAHKEATTIDLKWLKAMQEEYAALIAHYTWTSVSPLPNVDVVGRPYVTKDVKWCALYDSDSIYSIAI